MFSAKDRIYLSFYRGNDKVNVKNTIENSNIEQMNLNSLKWGNIVSAFRWNHVYNPKLFSNFTISFTKYEYDNLFYQFYRNDTITKKIDNSFLSGIKDFNVKLDFENYINPNIKLKFGGNFIYHIFSPGEIYFFQKGSDISLLDTSFNNSKIYAIENNIYIENEIKLFTW